MKTLLELAYTIMGFTRGKMAQLAESLPFESEDSSLIRRTYVKRLGIVARACEPRAGENETGGCLESTWCVPTPTVRAVMGFITIFPHTCAIALFHIYLPLNLTPTLSFVVVFLSLPTNHSLSRQHGCALGSLRPRELFSV